MKYKGSMLKIRSLARIVGIIFFIILVLPLVVFRSVFGKIFKHKDNFTSSFSDDAYADGGGGGGGGSQVDSDHDSGGY